MDNTNISLPKVGVIISSWNGAKWLEGCLQSAAAQDYPNLEIYLGDDASTDNTYEILNNYAECMVPHGKSDYLKDRRRIKFMNRTVQFFGMKENKGPSTVRNILIDAALSNGCHILAILDSDDQFLAGKISKCVAALMKDPNQIAGVYADYVHFNEETKAISYESKWSYDIFKLRQESIVHSGAVYNGACLKFLKDNYGYYYDERLNTVEDWCINKLLAQRWLFIHIPEPLTLVRVHNNSSVHYRSKEEWNRNWQYVAQIPL